MKKKFNLKVSKGIRFQMLGIASVIAVTFASFAYLMPENTTATESVHTTVPVTETTTTAITSTPAVTTSLSSATHTTTVRTFTTTVTTYVTTVVTSSATSTTTSSETTTATTSTSGSPTTTSATTTTVSETSVLTVPETTEEIFTGTTEKPSEYVIIQTSPVCYDEYCEDEYHNHDDDYNILYENDYNYDDEYYSESEYDSSEKTYLGTFKITHYCPCELCCGEYTGLTASGTIATAGRTAGASSSFEFGTQVEIDGHIYTIEDRGGFSENTIDIFCATHDEALEKGSYYTEVYIIN